MKYCYQFYPFSAVFGFSAEWFYYGEDKRVWEYIIYMGPIRLVIINPKKREIYNEENEQWMKFPHIR